MCSKSIDPLVQEVAVEILKGGKIADVIARHDLSHGTGRDYLHRYCKKINLEAYEQLAIEAVARGGCTPSQEQLQNNKELFIPQEERLYRPECSTDIFEAQYQQEKDDFDEFEREFRARRSKLAQMGRELAELKKLGA